ncbi:hypothetical protein BUALT_Bualt05G0095500 [Buddleja alternifolia]|uniref:Uncharacterized protein n=1 Tax=Buddleja alternifolia TaxID=168488 RepID=A0AAV6XHY5_9LAMI|nr:hypothetical protein BUALT_Bualt05G0095500 [Buddleja alternifolia]
MENNLIQAQNWSEAVRDGVSKVKLKPSDHNCDIKRLRMIISSLAQFISTLPATNGTPSHEILAVDFEMGVFLLLA